MAPQAPRTGLPLLPPCSLQAAGLCMSTRLFVLLLVQLHLCTFARSYRLTVRCVQVLCCAASGMWYSVFGGVSGGGCLADFCIVSGSTFG